MKKKIIMAAAAFAAITGALAISSPSVYAAEVPNEGISVVAEETSNTYFRVIPQELIDQGVFDYGGLHYTASASGYLTASLPSNPGAVKELILHYHLGRGYVTYPSTIDWTQFTGLENVIVTGTNMEFAQSILGALPSGTNLYVGCSCNFETALNTMPFKNIYLYFLYSPTLNSFSDSDFTNYLINSGVEKIYYNSFIGENFSSKVTEFNNLGHINKAGEEIQMESFNDWTYPKEIFYPFQSWDPTPPLFEAEGHWSCTTNSACSSMGSFMFWADTIDERVVDIDCSYIDSFHSLPTYQQFNKVYMPKNEDYQFKGIKANELIIRTYSGSAYLDLADLHYIKELRFVKSSATLQLYSNAALTEGSLLEKIYIPNEYKDKFTAITEDATLSQLVEYYDYSSWDAPTNSYLSDDGNTYCVSNYKYSIEEIETAVETLKAVGLEVPSGTVVDTLMDYYEFPIEDISSLTPSYAARKFDTIVLPKNMDATKVLEAFAMIAPLNHSQMCDSEGTTITCDTTNYTIGYNATLPITITFPDNTTYQQDVTVRVMATEDNKAYILDGKDIYVISNSTTEDTSLASLMSTLMECHLMETSVEYDESPILNTTSATYVAGNSYKASLSSGDAKVLISDVALVEETEDDNTGDNVTEEDNSVYEIKEIDKIYTPESIDGTKLLNQMRDFICTKDGEIYDEVSFVIGTNSGRTNKENYTFSAWATLSESYKYTETLSVDIIKSDYKMGFVVFTNGDIAVLFNAQEDYTQAQIETGIKAFLTSQSLNAESLSIPTSSYFETTTYEGSYDGGKVYIVNSGSNLYFTSSTKPTDQTALKEGYVALNRVMYTKDFIMEEAMRALGKNILLKDGKLVEEFEVSYTTKEDSNYVEVVFTSGDKELLKDTFYFQEVESEYSYIFARALEFDYGYLIMDKLDKAPEYDINDVMIDVISRFRTLMTPFETEVVVDFTKTGATDVDGVYYVGNGSYYSYEYNVEIANLDSVIKTNDVVVDGVEAPGETVSDKLNNFFDDFKAKFEESNAFKAATIALGTITGILLLWGAWAILKKILKWFRK